MRICITGGPRTGKTTLAAKMLVELTEIPVTQHYPAVEGGSRLPDIHLRHTDDLIGKFEWSDASAEVARWLDEPGPWIIEGVAVSRALRKWHEQNPGKAPPVDRVIYLETPHEALSKGQAAMAKGVAKVHAEIEAWLAKHGIRTEYPMTAHQKRADVMGGTT